MTIEIPSGRHVLKCLGRKTGSYDMNLQITAISVTTLETEGELGPAMDHTAVWASSGGWESSGALTHDGIDALRPAPPAEPPYSSYESAHVVQTPVSGPGYIRFATYVLDSPETSSSAPIQWASDVHRAAFRRFNDEGQGWMTHTLWYPPGEHWIRWRASGTAHALSLVAIDEMAFEASESLTFEEVVGSAGGIWENDPERPWSGLRKEAGGDAFIISPMIGPGEPTRISMTVEGPGEIGFYWSNSAMGNTEGELWIDGVKTSRELPWQEEGERVTLAVPHDRMVTLEWSFEARFAGNWAAMQDIVWTPWPEISLAEALDAPEQVTWETRAALPLKGRPDSGAENGSAAQVGLMPGEESWLEATVTGPGLFDFWLRGVPGSLNDPREVDWELFIDGVKSHIHTSTSTWPAQWVLGSGVHKIRLVFRNNTEGEEPAFIAVDDVSWDPLIPAPGEADWTASHPELAPGFADGGFNDGPQHVIPVATGEVRWIERSVTGPGVLAWCTRITKGGYPDFKRQVLINGIGAFPLVSMSGWDTNRLHLPEGAHTVRWTCEPGSFYEDGAYPAQTDAIWQISNVVFTPGVSPLMQGIDDEEMFWLAVGGADGSLVDAASAHDGEDAWSLGDETVLYLCNTTTRGIKARGMVFPFHAGSDEPVWTPIFRWAGPGESVEWMRAASDRSETHQSPRFVDEFTMEKIDVVSFDEAVDADQELVVNGWIGLAEADEAFDGIDAAWSILTRPYRTSTVSMTLQGPAKIRFRWRCSGKGVLGLRVDGAWLPVAVPEVDWQEVEFDVYESTLIEWVHAATPETNDELTGEAWLDAITIGSLPHRTIGGVAGEGSGLVFESTAGAGEADQWRAVAYRDAGGAWREGARGITGAAGLHTTVTGPAMISFRTYCAEVNIPPPVVNAPEANSPLAQSIIVISPDIGFITTARFFSVKVGDLKKLQIIPESGDGWTDHLVHVPAGEHRVIWQLGGTVGLGSSSEAIPPWQAWVGDVSLRHPREHYDSWRDHFLEGSAASGPGEDADGDGVINFIEYAYGSDPGNGSFKPAEMFGVVRPASRYFIDRLSPSVFALHVPRHPAHVTAILQTSTDLETWTRSPIPLRSFHSVNSSLFGPDPRDYDSGIHQVIPFDIVPEQPATFYRIQFDLP